MMGNHRVATLFRSPGLYVAALTLVGLFVRIYRIGARGFWFDEIVFAYAARLPTFGDLLKHVQEWSDHTPLSFFLVWFVRGFGADEAVVRLPFAIAGALSIPALYLLGKTLWNTRVGILAALAYALSPFAVFVSQDTHPYATLMLFSTLQALFAYRAATKGRVFDWLGFGLFMLLNLYNDYLALALVAVTLTFLVITLLGRLARVLQSREQETANKPGIPAPERVNLRNQFLAFAATVATVAILYLSWLSPTLVFLGMPVRTYYSTRTGGATLEDIGNLATGLGFDLLLSAALVVGVLYAAFVLWRKRSAAALLLLIWVWAPLAGLWLLAGDRIFILQTRYFSFLVPAALVLAALGVDRIAVLAQDVYERFTKSKNLGNQYSYYFAFAGLVALIVLTAIPTLINSYSWPKPAPQAFREAARRIIDDSPPGSVAVSVGMWGIKPAPPFTIQGIEHYLWLYKSPIPYLDASLIDEATARQLSNKSATVWGVWALPWPIEAQYIESAADAGLELIQLENIVLVREKAPGGAAGEQLDRLLAWSIGLQRGLIATRALVNPAYKAEALGENVLPPMDAVQIPAQKDRIFNGEEEADRWVLWGSSSLASTGRSLVLNGNNPNQMTNITLSTSKLVPGETYVMSFRYKNVGLKGEQRVYLSTNTGEGLLIETFPYGQGFLCTPNTESGSAFTFVMPENATNALLWLRSTGDGQAEFTGVEIRPVR